MFTLFAIKVALSGLGNLLWDYSWTTLLAAGLIIGSFFVDEIPVLGYKVAADMRWAAVCILGCLLWGAHIEHDTNLHWEAKQATIDKAVTDAGKKAIEHPSAPGRWETDQ